MDLEPERKQLKNKTLKYDKFPIPERVAYICQGDKCGKKGGKELYKILRSSFKENGRKNCIEPIRTECSKRCDFAPVMSIQPDNIWLKEYKISDVLRLLAPRDEE